MIGDQIAAAALDWVGTPFVWGQSVKAVGCDCKGVIVGVLAELGRTEAECVHAKLANYRADRPVPAATLLEGFRTNFRRVKRMRAGDFLLLNLHGRPAHMAIHVGGDRAVHAYPGGAVKDRPLSVLFHKFPLHSVWRCR